MIPPGTEPDYCKEMLSEIFGLSKYEANLAVEEIMIRTGCTGTSLIVAVCMAIGIEPIEVIGGHS